MRDYPREKSGAAVAPVDETREQGEQEIAAIAPGYSFLSALRTLNRHLGIEEFGRDAFDDHRRLVVTHRPNLKTASAELSAVHLDPRALLACRDRAVLQNERMGLFAPIGVLPIDYTEHAMHEERHRHSTAFRDFVNLGLSRLALLDYRAWAQLQPSASADRRDSDHFRNRLLNLAGQPAGAGRLSMAERARAAWPIAYVGLRRHPRHLIAIASSLTGLPARVLERARRWRPAAEHATRLGTGPEGRLGGAAIGRRFLDVQHSVELVFGAVEGERYRALLSNRPMIAAVCELVGDFDRGKFDVRISVDVRLKRADSACLGAGTARLGHGWLSIEEGAQACGCVSRVCLVETGNDRGY